jgi:hypothetical protein
VHGAFYAGGGPRSASATGFLIAKVLAVEAREWKSGSCGGVALLSLKVGVLRQPIAGGDLEHEGAFALGSFMAPG